MDSASKVKEQILLLLLLHHHLLLLLLLFFFPSKSASGRKEHSVGQSYKIEVITRSMEKSLSHVLLPELKDHITWSGHFLCDTHKRLSRLHKTIA